MSQPIASQGIFLQNRRIPAWLMSLVLHLIVVLCLAFAFRIVKKGVDAQADRNVGIALVKQHDGKREYVFSDQQADQDSESQNQQPSLTEALPSAAELSVDLTGILPSAEEGAVGNGDLAVQDATDLSSGSDAGTKGLEGKTSTAVFGITGTGSKFVYVFDRSGSMSGAPLLAAQQQLIHSLRDLGDVHQFQIIFYNERPKVFQQRGKSPSLFWADEKSKKAASRFVASIEAGGGTRHMDAIKLALSMGPDVIFFLTDADEPQLTEAELRKIRGRNHGVSINAIEFGTGPQRHETNFLTRMAAQNGGQHAYVDITLLSR